MWKEEKDEQHGQVEEEQHYLTSDRTVTWSADVKCNAFIHMFQVHIISPLLARLIMTYSPNRTVKQTFCSNQWKRGVGDDVYFLKQQRACKIEIRGILILKYKIESNTEMSHWWEVGICMHYCTTSTPRLSIHSNNV